MEELKELIEMLSKTQFQTQLDIVGYVFVVIFAGAGAWFASFLREKGKNYATKRDFEKIIDQVKRNTEVVEEVKARFSEKGWITQQVWLKKQETYQTIFSLLLNVRKYVSHQIGEFEEWEYINKYHPYIQNYPSDSYSNLEVQWKKEKEEYESKSKSPELKREAEKLKVKYESSIAKLFDLLDVYAIYLDDKVEEEIRKLKQELSTTKEYEEYNSHFERISKATSEAIDNIRFIGREELRI